MDKIVFRRFANLRNKQRIVATVEKKVLRNKEKSLFLWVYAKE